MGSFILSDTFATTNELRKRIIKLEKVNENIIDQIIETSSGRVLKSEI